MCVETLKLDQYDYIQSAGGLMAIHGKNQILNDYNRQIVSAIRSENEHCYIGRISFYGKEKQDVIAGRRSIYTTYVGQYICDFSYDFCVPNQDKPLEEMIQQWNRGGSANLLIWIINRIDSIGGYHMVWTKDTDKERAANANTQI